VGYVAQILGFMRTDTGCATNGDDGLEECEKWLKAHGIVLSEGNSGELQIDMKVPTLSIFFMLLNYSLISSNYLKMGGC
jgi:SAC3 family protein LENG8/THP3